MRRFGFLLAAAALTAAVSWAASPSLHAQSDNTVPPEPPAPESKAPENLEGSMTVEHMGEIIARLDPEAENVENRFWRFKVEELPVIIVTDEKNNRMRILVGIRSAKDMTSEEIMRVMQANFDSALDARYAIAKDILWSAFIHPLRTLHTRQFIAAIGQTVNLALTYGTTYTSGLLTYGGGDSNEIIRRELIDKLLKKGTEI